MLARSPPVWFEQRSGLTKDCKHDIYWFSSKNTTLRRRDKEWLAQNQDNLSEWSDTSSRRMLFQWAATIKIKLTMLVKNKTDIIIISLICNLFSPWYTWTNCSFDVKQQSVTYSTSALAQIKYVWHLILLVVHSFNTIHDVKTFLKTPSCWKGDSTQTRESFSAPCKE